MVDYPRPIESTEITALWETPEYLILLAPMFATIPVHLVRDVNLDEGILEFLELVLLWMVGPGMEMLRGYFGGWRCGSWSELVR